MLTEFTPASTFRTVIPRAGVQAYNYTVRLIVIARDGLLSTGTSYLDIVVTERNLGSLEEQSFLVNNLLEQSETSLSNGDSEGALVLVRGLAELLNHQV